MQTERYGVQFDYVWEREHYLVGTWMAGSLNGLDVRILKNQSISGMLPLQIVTHNTETKLYYTVSGKKPLSVWLRTNPPAQEEAARLLYRLASILEDCRTFLLSEQQVLLDEEYIYMGEHAEDVSVVYLPVRQLMDKPAVQQQFRLLANKLLENRIKVEGDVSYAHLRSLLSRGTRPLSDMKQGLGEAIAKQGGDAPREDDEPPPHFERVLLPNPTRERKQSLERKSANQDVWLIGRLRFPRHRLLFAGLAAATLLCLVRLLLVPTAGMGHVCLGFLLLTAAAVIVLMPEPVRAMDTAELKQNQEPSAIPQSYYDALPQETTLLVQPHATVLLTEQSAPSRNPNAWVEWQEDGQTRQATLENDRLTIGRSGESELRIDAVDVSRAHAEIEHAEETVFLVDLGSTNGTFRNGERLIPFKRCPLESGDRIRIAGKEYIFKKFPPAQGFPS